MQIIGKPKEAIASIPKLVQSPKVELISSLNTTGTTAL